MVLARPVAADKFDLASVGLVEDGVVEDEDAVVEGDIGPGLGPEDGRIGFESVEQSGESVVDGLVGLFGLDA